METAALTTTIRELPSEEWSKLKGIEGFADFIPAAGTARIQVAEQGDKIVGVWVAQLAICAEPVWIAYEHRNRTLGLLLFEALTQMMKEEGIRSFMIHAADDGVGDYLIRLGLKATGWQAFMGKIEQPNI